jgi:hypothetical protein
MFKYTRWSSSMHLLRMVVMRHVLACVCFTLAVLANPTQCYADPITPDMYPITPDIWNEFSFVQVGVQARGCSPVDTAGLACIPGSDSVFLGAPAWTYTAPADGATLRVTDAFNSGDAFLVLDFGSLLGVTPIVAPGSSCGSDPDACFANASMSHNTFLLSPGAHSLTITPIEVQQPGAAYLRVEPVPEPESLLLLFFGVLVSGLRLRWIRATGS